MKKKLLNLSLILSLIALLYGILYLIPKGAKNSINSELMSDGLDNIEQLMKGVHLVESDGQSKMWELWSNEAKNYRDTSDWELENIKVHFFTDNGDYFIVTGDKGYIISDSQNVEIIDNVIVESKNGYKLSTEKAVYSASERKIFGPSSVRMRSYSGKKKALDLVGNSFSINLVDSSMFLFKGVKGVKVNTDNTLTKLDSEEAQFFSDSYRAEFLKNVTIKFTEYTVKAIKASFGFIKENQGIKSVRFKGNVRLSDLSKNATCDLLYLDYVDKIITLSGTPKITQGDDHMQGDEIVISDGGNNIKVKSLSSKFNRETLGK